MIAKRKGVAARRGLKEAGAKARADEQKPDEEAYGSGWASEPKIAKPTTIKAAGGKSGGCASKAVELTSGDLPWLS